MTEKVERKDERGQVHRRKVKNQRERYKDGGEERKQRFSIRPQKEFCVSWYRDSAITWLAHWLVVPNILQLVTFSPSINRLHLVNVLELEKTQPDG